MTFRLVLSLRLIHRFYSDGVCPDFVIEPTNGTEWRLRNHRCVLKAGRNWIRAYMDPDLIPLAQGEVFGFHLRLRNPNFALFTDMREISSMPAPLYTNAEAHSSSSRTTLSLKSRSTLHRDSISTPLRRGVFADVEIVVNKPEQEGQRPALGEYQIVFQSKQARWIYYLVTNHSADQFGIEDKGLDAISFSATDLNLEPDPTDEIATALAKQHVDSKRFRFVSNELVECRQAARNNIQLRGGADSASGSLLADALPNPALGNLSMTNGHGDKRDSLFQIFRYVTHSFSTSGG